MCTAVYNKLATGKQVYRKGSSAQCSVMAYRVGWQGLGKEAHEGGDLCVIGADSHRCTAETKHNTVK